MKHEKIDVSDFKMGLSIAASWAWGTSLIIGMQIAQQKGLGAWFIWAIANSLTLLFFGLLYGADILGRNIFDLKPIKISAILIQCFCLVIQLNIINNTLLDIGLDKYPAIFTSTAIGVIFIVWMYKHGLITSVKTDCVQFTVTILSILTILALGLYNGEYREISVTSSTSDILWGIFSACILLSGPIGDMQHWQRAEASNPVISFRYGSYFFALYMLLVLAMSYFRFTETMNLILLLAVICVTSSTIDSIAVSLHEISSKQIGTAVALFICVLWPVFTSWGVLTIWTNAGIFRVLFAISILGLSFYQIVRRRKENDEFIQ